MFLRRFAGDMTMGESTILLLIAMGGMVLLVVSGRLTGSPVLRKVLLGIVYGLIALVFILQFLWR